MLLEAEPIAFHLGLILELFHISSFLFRAQQRCFKPKFKSYASYRDLPLPRSPLTYDVKAGASGLLLTQLRLDMIG